MNTQTLSLSGVENDHRFEKLISRADDFMLLILWVHLPFTSFLATYSYGTWREALLASLFICVVGTISYIVSRGTYAHRILNGLLLLSYSIVLISVQYGRIEMHFHVFAVLPFLILYRDWRIIPPAAILIAVQHAVFNYCQENEIDFLGFPLIAFNYGSGWDIVLLHAFFLFFECSVIIYYSKVLREQFIEVNAMNENLESLVERRTRSLEREKSKIEAYKKTLDLVAITTLTDDEGVLIDVNENFEKITEYTREELIGKTHGLIRSTHHSEEFFRNMWKELKEGKTWRGEIHNKTSTGKHYWVDTAIAPLKSSSGKIVKFMAIKFDITSKKMNEETILKQQEQIVSQSKLSALGEMAGGIAHEINNPLAIISASMASLRKMILKDMIETDDFKETLQDIDDTVVRITKIIVGLRNVSRDTSNEGLTDCLIDDLLNDAFSLCSEKFKSSGVEFLVEVDDSLRKSSIQIMRIQLSQVLLNILTNAYDAISDKEEKWVKVSIDKNDENLIIKITDSGEGIPKEVQDKIFRPFYTTKEIGKGTGLGLSLSRSIIERHHGKFYIDDEEKNTCFVISIPFRVV